MSDENKADLMQMLAVPGVLAAPGYTDKPQRLPASKLGGGRNKTRTMHGSVVVVVVVVVVVAVVVEVRVVK